MLARRYIWRNPSPNSRGKPVEQGVGKVGKNKQVDVFDFLTDL